MDRDPVALNSGCNYSLGPQNRQAVCLQPGVFGAFVQFQQAQITSSQRGGVLDGDVSLVHILWSRKLWKTLKW